jgi:hypothetical protein
MPPNLVLALATDWRDHVLRLWRDWERQASLRSSDREKIPTALRAGFARVLREHDPRLFDRALADLVAEECVRDPDAALAALPWIQLVPGKANESARAWRRLSAVRSRMAATSARAVLAAEAPTIPAMLDALPADVLANARLAGLCQTLARSLLPHEPRAPATRVTAARERLVTRAIEEARATATQTDVAAGLLRAGLALADTPVRGWSHEYARRRFASEVAGRVQRSAWWSTRTGRSSTHHA